MINDEMNSGDDREPLANHNEDKVAERLQQIAANVRAPMGHVTDVDLMYIEKAANMLKSKSQTKSGAHRWGDKRKNTNRHRSY